MNTQALLAQLGDIGEENQRTLGNIDARLTDMEKRMVRAGPDGPGDQGSSWGRAFTNERSTELAGLESTRGRTSLEVRAALTTAVADADGSAGGLSVPKRNDWLSAACSTWCR